MKASLQRKLASSLNHLSPSPSLTLAPPSPSLTCCLLKAKASSSSGSMEELVARITPSCCWAGEECEG